MELRWRFPIAGFTSEISILFVMRVCVISEVKPAIGNLHRNSIQFLQGQVSASRISQPPTLEELYGVAVEISDSGFYFRDQHTFCDEGMREVMDAIRLTTCTYKWDDLTVYYPRTGSH
jgi:hypothetical protein